MAAVFPTLKEEAFFKLLEEHLLSSLLIVGVMRTQHGKGRWDSLWWGGAATPRWVRGGTPSSHPGLLSPRGGNKAQNHPSTWKGIFMQKLSSHLGE